MNGRESVKNELVLRQDVVREKLEEKREVDRSSLNKSGKRPKGFIR